MGDQAAREASEVVLERSCFFVACCRHEEPLGVGRCTWRTAFAFGSLDLSVRGKGIRNTGAESSKTCVQHDDDHSVREIKTLYK